MGPIGPPGPPGPEGPQGATTMGDEAEKEVVSLKIRVDYLEAANEELQGKYETILEAIKSVQEVFT